MKILALLVALLLPACACAQGKVVVVKDTDKVVEVKVGDILQVEIENVKRGQTIGVEWPSAHLKLIGNDEDGTVMVIYFAAKVESDEIEITYTVSQDKKELRKVTLKVKVLPCGA